MSAPANWPRPYIMQIYAEAVKHGFVWINNLEPGPAASLKMSIYRARRRSDTSNKTLIAPEYHLVTVGQYDIVKRRMPVMYNKLPDGEPLPSITTEYDEELPLGGEAHEFVLPETPQDFTLPVTADVQGSIPTSAVELSELQIPDYVKQMMDRVKEQSHD
jgi:hypothetical protein